MALRFVFDNKTVTFATSELCRSRLLGVKMIEACFTSDNLAVLSKLQSLSV